MNRLLLTTILALFLLAPAVLGDSYRFVVLPDTHSQCTGGFPNPASKAVDKIISDIKPQFVLHVGDMIDFDTAASKVEPCPSVMWSKFDKEVVAKLAEAKIPFFPSPGNHDYQFGMAANYKTKWSSFSNPGITIDGSYSGWYSFDVGKSHFVSLVAPGETFLIDGEAQMKWLADDLKKAKDRGAENIFTFGHAPIYVPAMKKGSRVFDTDSSYLAKQKGLVDLLKQYNVKAYFSGHMHLLSDKTQNGIRDIISGVISGGDRGSLVPGSQGTWTFLVVDVNGQDVKIYPVTYPYSTTNLPAPKEADVKLVSAVGAVPVGQNIPYGTISSVLYDIVISTALGKTSILGIARQPIAVGVDKKQLILPSNFICKNITPETKLDIDMLKKNYGAQQTDIEAQINKITFLDKEISIHRKIAPIFKCLEVDIKKCSEYANYKIDEMKGFEWMPVGDTLAPSSFGVTVTINPSRNPISPTLNSDIPKCFIDAFKSKGFAWGGDFKDSKIPSTFYFLADPAAILLYDPSTNAPLNAAASSVPATGACQLTIPADLDSQSIGKYNMGSLRNAFQWPVETDYTRQTWDASSEYSKKRRREISFATVEMIQATYNAACLTFPKTNQKIGVGDFSLKFGGATGRHQSHESGRDVDVWFYDTTRNKGQRGGWEATTDDVAKPCNENRYVDATFDIPGNWEYIKNLISNNDIKTIFVHCAIEKKLVEYGQTVDPALAAKAASIMTYYRNHHHHYHIRINCPKGDTQCVN